MAGSNDSTITLKLVAEDLMSGKIGSAIGKIDTLAKRGGIVGSVFQGVGISMGMMLNPLVLVTRGIGVVTDYLSSSAQAAEAEQVNIQHLTTALQANAKGWDGNTDSVEALIYAREGLAFSDDAQRDSLAKLVAVTGDLTAAQDLEREAMDVARGRQIDLASASDLVTKVYNGQYGLLKRIGIVIDSTATRQEALAAVQKKYAGQALGYAKTAVGAQETFANTMQDVQEEIGGLLLGPATQFITFLDKVAGHSATAGGAVDLLTQKIKTMIPPVPPTQGKGPIESLMDGLNELNKLTDANERATQDAMVAHERLIQSLGGDKDAIRLLLDTARKAGVSWDVVWADLAASVSHMTQETAQTLLESAGPFSIASKAAFKTIPGAAGAAADDAVTEIDQMADDIVGIVKDAKSPVKAAMKALKNAIDNPMKEAHTVSKLEAQLMGKDLQKGLTSKNPYIAASYRHLRDVITAQLAAIMNALDDTSKSHGLLDLAAQFGRGGGGGGGGHNHAAGGHYRAGEIRITGERGPELDIPDHSGTIIPAGKWGRGGGSSSTVVNINFNSMTPPTDAEATRIANVIGPALTRWQRRQPSAA